MQPSIREALAGDAPRIVQLCVQLGYDVPLAHVEGFLQSGRADGALLVAVVPRVGVVGWIGIAARVALLASQRADVEGLVVEDEYRGHGIGALLLDAAQDWARKHGCASIRVLSNVIRERAHKFYVERGFELRKSEHVFTKEL